MTSSSTTRAEEYISLNNGTKDDSDSKIDGGRTVTSSSSPPFSVTPPPYTRIVLMTFDCAGGSGDGDDIGRVADSLPPSLLQLQQPHVTLEEWRDLWSRVQPKLEAMKGLNQKSAPLLQTVFLLFLLLSIPLICLSNNTIFHFSMLYCILLSILFIGLFGIARVQRQHFASLQTLFREEEELVFRRTGVVIDCECECVCVAPSLFSTTSAYVVNFLPLTSNTTTNESRQTGDASQFDNGTRHGYLRIQLFADNPPTLCGNTARETVLLLQLASHRTLPTTVFSILDLDTTQLWDRFWSRLMEQSLELAPFTLHGWMPNLFPVFMRFKMIQTYNRIKNQRFELVHEYAPKFAKLGLWVELRCLYHADFGAVRYLYVLSLPHLEAPGGIKSV